MERPILHSLSELRSLKLELGGRRRFIRMGVWSVLGGASFGVLPQSFQSANSENEGSFQRESLRLVCDESLVQSGLVGAWLRSFINHTGVLVAPISVSALVAFQQLERGEAHLSLTNDPDRELDLERQGWAHMRTLVGRGGFVVVGPHSAARALRHVISAHRDPGASMMVGLMRAIARQGLLFLSRPDASATHRFEELMWGIAKINPEGPWYRRDQGGGAYWLHAKKIGACTMVEKGVWARVGAHSGLIVLADQDPALNIDLHVMESAKTRHSGSRLFMNWLTGPMGQGIISRWPGYRSIKKNRVFSL